MDKMIVILILLIDKMILKNCRRRKTGLGIVWVHYKKAYDMVPHSWIIECMNMFGIAENLSGIIQNSVKQWNTGLTAGNQVLGEVYKERYLSGG